MQTAATFMNTWFSRPIHTSKFLWFIVLIGLGLSGNILKIELFFNVDFLFGSMFAMLVLQIFGILPGILAAAIISSWSIVLWNHPYAIIIQAAEVAAVGWATSRRNMGLIAADVLYWICCGMPLVALFYMGIMKVSVHGVLLVMVKQAVNGIMNALFARLIAIGFVIRFRHTPVSIRDIVHGVSFFILLVPVMALIAVESRIDSSATDDRLQTTLRRQSKQISRMIDIWINHRKTTICRLAELAASENVDQIERTLHIVQEADSHYDTIALIDLKGAVLLSTSALDQTGAPMTGKSLADHPWYRLRQDIQQAMLTEVFEDRNRMPPLPVAAMVAPVVSGNRTIGYIEGILNLDPIRSQLEAAIFGEVSFFSLIDRNGNVIFTDRPGQALLKPIDRSKGRLQRIDDFIGLWIPDVPPNSSIMERWENTKYITTSTIDEVSGWRLELEQSLGPDRKALFDKYSQELTLLFAFLLAALLLTEWLSRRSIAIFDQLCTVTGRLPDRLLDQGKGPDVEAWPRSMVTESKTLIDNFDKMVRILVAQYREIQQSSDALRNRTRELWEANRSQELEISARQKAEELLQNLLSEKEVLLREIHHRVKNNLAAIIGLIDLHSRKMLDPMHQNSMTELCTRIRSMSLVHEQLYHSENLARIDFQTYVESLVQHIVASYEHQEDIAIHTNAHGVLMSLDEAVPCGLIVTELLTNAFKYAFPPDCTCHQIGSCAIDVIVARNNDTIHLLVSDNGIGLPSDPDWTRLETLGLLLVKMLGQHQLRGKIEVERTSGTTIRVIFPAKKMRAEDGINFNDHEPLFPGNRYENRNDPDRRR